MAPGPFISAIIIVLPPSIHVYGFTFHPTPNSLACSPLTPSFRAAFPPLPGSPVKFSGLIDLVLALDNLNRLPMFISRPLKRVVSFCANADKEQQNKKVIV